MTAELAESDPPFVQFAARDLSEEFQNVGNNWPGGSSSRDVATASSTAPESYVKAHEKYYETFKYLREKDGYADTLLLDATHGDVIFTTEKGADFGVASATSTARCATPGKRRSRGNRSPFRMSGPTRHSAAFLRSLSQDRSNRMGS